MIVTRKIAFAALATLVLVAGAAVTTGSAADARATKPVITSVEPAVGSSVGYAHVIIRGRHLTGGKVTVAGRHVYAKVISSTVISAFPAGHHHGKRYRVVVRTKAGKSNTKRYEYRYVRQPGSVRVARASAAPGGTVATLGYSTTRCPAAGTCVSIGGDDRGPVARVTTGGRTVTQRIPVPADYDHNGTAYLADLSCPTVTFCLAVGGYNSSVGGLLSTWNGSAWTTRSAPHPPGYPYTDGNLTRVSCGAPSHCVAISDASVYTLDNGAAAIVAGVAPSGNRHAQFARVSCPAAGWCSLVGSGDVGKTTRNFVAIRRGTAWSARTISNPRGLKGRIAPDLDGFDCAHTDRCTLLAGGLAGGARAPLWFATLHAGAVRWTKVPLPADAKKSTTWVAAEYADASLHCPSTGTCWALSAYSVRGLSGSRGYQPVALRLHDGAKVRAFALPRPASSKTGRFDLLDLSCATPSYCVAVGTRGDSDVNNIHGDAIVETYAGGVWTPAAAPSPSGRPKYSGYEFTSIDCAGVARCTAVGDYNYDHNPDAEDDQPLQKSRPVVLTVAPR